MDCKLTEIRNQNESRNESQNENENQNQERPRAKYRFLLAALGLFVGFQSFGVFAFTPSPEQIEQFQSLSPAEQRKLASSMGVELPRNMSPVSKPVTSPETVAPRALEEDDAGPVEFEAGKGSVALSDPEVSSIDPENDLEKDTVEEPPKPFGYELFAGNPTTFAPATDIPVPVDYSIGPGDSIIVQLYGKENSTSELVVSREGEIQFPEIGPISVNGLHFGDLKKRVDQLVKEQMIGVKASVTMGALRSIRVFVLGEAYRPGSYTVSSLSTMTNALFASGGIEKIGSLRHISLKRNGKIVSELDLYDLLMRGDTSKDRRLMPGDVLFIPTVKKTVTITGEVRRPAIYEIKDETNLAQMVILAGGYAANAFPAASRVARVNSQGHRTVDDVDLKTQTGRLKTLRDGDVLNIPSVLDKLEGIVTVSGHVHREGHFNWRSGLRVKDVLGDLNDLRANPDLTIALIKRETGLTRKVEFLTFNLGAALRGQSGFNIELQPRDEIIIFQGGATDRAEQLKDHVELLNEQHFGDGHPQLVALSGEVKSPGTYPLAQGMTLAEALQLAGYLTVDGSRHGVILARQNPVTNSREFQQVRIGTQAMSQQLSARDEIFVFSKVKDRKELLLPLLTSINSLSQYGVPSPVLSIDGAVRFPGDYPLVANATVQSLIDLAGGLREDAYKVAGELSRVITHDSKDGYSVSHDVISLEDDQGLATSLQSRDRLVVKSVPEWGDSIEVTLNGEVRFPGVYPVMKGETISTLLQRAGGLTDQADPKGAIFLRESLRKKEKAMLERFQNQLEEEASAIAAKKSEEAGQVSDINALKDTLLSQIKDADATGRLVFNLVGILEDDNSALDVVLKKGDTITIPAFIQEVSILGEVNFPTSHLYEKSLNAGKYLQKSGGVTRKADKKGAYVISRDGSVRPMYKWKFLWFGMKRKLEPGDTLVVPTDIDRLHPLTVWQKTSQILFQLATTAAALQTVGAI